MKPKEPSLNSLRADYRRFLAAPYPVKKHYVVARATWARYRRLSMRNIKDHYKTLYKLEIPKGTKKADVYGKEILSELRSHLVSIQGNRCCYCRRWLQNVAHARPIEHVLPRGSYPQFSLHYWNLAVACRDCNQLKGETNWSGVNVKTVAYPKPGSVKDYFHPRLHAYDVHIRYVRIETNVSSIAIYLGLTPQGRRLCRDHLKKISYVDALYSNNPNISAAVRKLQDYGDKVDVGQMPAFDKFLESLSKTIHSLGMVKLP